MMRRSSLNMLFLPSRLEYEFFLNANSVIGVVINGMYRSSCQRPTRQLLWPVMVRLVAISKLSI